jgi:hypothetical protein
MRVGLLSIAFGAMFLVAGAAGERAWADGAHRGGAHVKGSVQKRGGYSYTYEDSINTYGDPRRYGSTRSFRDPGLDKQSQGGPFDSGFFFDSATAPRGGDAPLMH